MMFDDVRDLYQEVILDHGRRPRNFRRLEDADRSARGDNPLCGDRMELWLKLGPAGEITKEHSIRDLNWREIAMLAPLLILIFWIGLYPAPFFNLMAPAVDKLVSALSTAALAMH